MAALLQSGLQTPKRSALLIDSESKVCDQFAASASGSTILSLLLRSPR
jgi:hypothetical protein